MKTLDNTTANKIPLLLDGSINMKFTADEVLSYGSIVRLNASGKVEACDAATEVPIGVVVVTTGTDEETVTVSTNFRSVIHMVADAAITVGDLVSITADTASVNAVTTTGAEEYAVGIALATAADTASVKVGLFYAPVLTPAAP